MILVQANSQHGEYVFSSLFIYLRNRVRVLYIGEVVSSTTRKFYLIDFHYVSLMHLEYNPYVDRYWARQLKSVELTKCPTTSALGSKSIMRAATT